jgi:NAD(P)-dependent dehydrogenase (short-subunit alcohol dehydrogenase family)
MQHVLVTSGSEHPGSEIVAALLADGCLVSVVDRQAPPPWWSGGTGMWHVSAASPSQRELAATVDAAERFAPLTGLVVVPEAAERTASILELDAGALERAFAVAVARAADLCAAYSRTKVRRGTPGSIVLLSSIATGGFSAREGLDGHVMASAIAGLSHSMAGDLARFGIRVNTVAVGDGSGARIPAAREVSHADVAATVAWLVSPRASLTTGHVLPVDGGETSLAVPPVGGFALVRAGKGGQ